MPTRLKNMPDVKKYEELAQYGFQHISFAYIEKVCEILRILSVRSLALKTYGRCQIQS